MISIRKGFLDGNKAKEAEADRGHGYESDVAGGPH